MNAHRQRRERNAAVVAAYRKPGATLETVAADFGVTPRRVSQILQFCGEMRRPQGRPAGGAPRKHQGFKNRSERFRDVDGERESPAPTRRLYSCPGCGTRAANPMGHAQCQKQEAA